MAANAGETKVKLWEGICYPENMLDDWQEEIDDILQVPFAYAIHDIDHDQKSKQRKTHVHIIVVWGGNTTRKAIINVLNRCGASQQHQARIRLPHPRHGIVPKEGQGTVPSRSPHRGEQLRHRAA